MYFSEPFYDCDGNCISDVDGDEVCDELEIDGCIDVLACNYNNEATESDDSCFYSEVNYDCNGNCNNDQDGDQVCDENEISGCTSWWANNYDVNATEDNGLCFLEGCTNINYFEYNSYATLDDGSYCLTLSNLDVSMRLHVIMIR